MACFSPQPLQLRVPGKEVNHNLPLIEKFVTQLINKEVGKFVFERDPATFAGALGLAQTKTATDVTLKTASRASIHAFANPSDNSVNYSGRGRGGGQGGRGKSGSSRPERREGEAGTSVYEDDVTGLPQNSDHLKHVLKIIRQLQADLCLAINLDKSEVLELGTEAGTCGLRVKDEIKITGIWFAKDKQQMDKLTWGGVVAKVKTLLNAWSGRRLTIIGRTNIIPAQVQPLISFVAGSQCKK
jgi:hypothetical protein